MRIPGVKTAKAFSRWLRARLLGGAIILGYHRVAEASQDAYQVCVSPEHFAEQMELVRKYTRPIHLSKLVQHLQEGSLPAKTIAVTFDDGYADNFYNARPLLEKYQIPATVFVSTGYLGKELWWDELDRLVMSSQAAPGDLCLKIRESQVHIDQKTVALTETESPDTISLRRQFRHSLYHFLLPLDIPERDHLMSLIRSWSGVSSSDPSDMRAMNHAELENLVADGLVELGAHTRTHPMLPRLTLERQREEIVSSKQDLEDLLGKRVTGFAYPNGRATDDAKKIVRDAGFTYACTSLHDVVRPGSDTFQLTRFWQEDVGGEKFLRALKLWMTL